MKTNHAIAFGCMLIALATVQLLSPQQLVLTHAKAQPAPIDTTDKNVRTYRTTYVPDADETEFVAFSDKYDARTRTRKVTNRKKVLRKVKKLKKSVKTINPKQARKVNWLYDKPVNITMEPYNIEVDTEKQRVIVR